MLRRFVTVLAFIAIACADLFAHAGLRFSSPLEGATLGDTPSTVQLTLGEKPEPSLSSIHVIDTSGATYDVGRPAPVPGDPLSLSIAVRPLGTGVYTVNWRVVSAVDGHASAGAYVFGVRASPAGVAAPGATSTVSWLEVVARGLLIAGLVVLLGAATADIARFGGPHDLWLASAGWLLSCAGLALLAKAQTGNAGASLSALLNTSVGRALVWRTVAIVLAGSALAVGWRTRSSQVRTRPGVMTSVALAALFAIAVHANAGHAAAGRFHPLTTVAVQWAHFAASGIWIGGLAALLVGLKGTPSDLKAISVRRFSAIAGAGIGVVAVSGIWRAVNELASWDDLTTTDYGRAVLIKAALLVLIAALGALNRWNSVPRADTDLGPLRRLSGGELGLAAAALATAAWLGTLPPPAAATPMPGLTASGVDFGTTVRVSLSAASDQPGPNHFIARIVDYDSKKSLRARRVSLRFTPLDDPGIAPSSLALAAGLDDSYTGSGANLAFDGRWQVTALIERDRDSVEVPMPVDVRTPTQFLSIERDSGQPPMYTVSVKGLGHIRFSPDPERPGPSKLRVTCFNGIFEDLSIEGIVVTAASGHGAARQLSVRRVDRSRFVADVELQPGRNRLAAVARIVDGSRMRASLDIDVPSR